QERQELSFSIKRENKIIPLSLQRQSCSSKPLPLKTTNPPGRYANAVAHGGNPLRKSRWLTEERQRAEGVPHKFALRIANLWGPRRGQKGQVF
ncbi:hypothetical protein CEN50_12990, partial [Fischerella thermalis CCMEE 5268]